MLDGVARGLYVTEMMGFGFNAVTGDFSRGAGGFLDRERRARPARSARSPISRNFDELLEAIDAVGDDLDLRSSTACPTFRVAKMMVAGR